MKIVWVITCWLLIAAIYATLHGCQGSQIAPNTTVQVGSASKPAVQVGSPDLPVQVIVNVDLHLWDSTGKVGERISTTCAASMPVTKEK